ncbi:hypothetical protein V6N12_015120 [Hibiscus sabdariffa]|uniref:Uncharacterized protein n=1 Tax=Hibiscus sabdariffa TaxID=183260 RepID=A0ABR2DQ71_9ROSI
MNLNCGLKQLRVSEDRYRVTWNYQHTEQVAIGPKCVDRLQPKISTAEMEHHVGNVDVSLCPVLKVDEEKVLRS